MGESCCSGTVDIRAMEARQRQVLMIVLAINIATFVMMLSAANYSGSSSLLSGSLDNLGDALTYLLSIAVIGASTRAKAKVALLKGLLILGAAMAVAVQIGWRLAHPEVPVFEAIGIAALLNLAFNGICLWLLTPYRHGDVNIRAASTFSTNDFVANAGVLIGGGLVLWLGQAWPDLVVGLAVAGIALKGGIDILHDAHHETDKHKEHAEE